MRRHINLEGSRIRGVKGSSDFPATLISYAVTIGEAWAPGIL